MGVPFKSTDKPNPNFDDSGNSGKSGWEIFDSQSDETIQTPNLAEPTIVEIATIESLPPIKPKQESGVRVMEFLRQLLGITPGMLMLLITGMQLCWAVTEFDMAVYKKMYLDSIYKIGMLVVCGFYIGAIFGQLIGAIFVIHLKKKLIYLICAFLLIVSGEFLKNCYEVPYHIIGRTLLGFVHSIVQLTVITYASETTTKNIRAKLLSSLAFINMLSIWMGTGLAFGNIALNDDGTPGNATLVDTDTDSEYVVDDLDIISISGMAIMLIAFIALILTPFITRESIPFLVRDNSNDIAYKQFVAIRHTSDDDSSSNDKFEDWRNSILIHPEHSVHIFQKANFKSLMLLGHTRILSLLFNSIFMSVTFTRLLLFDDETNVRWFYNETMSYGIEELKYSLDLLVGFKTMSFVSGLLLLITGFKLKVERSCYKLAFVWGLSAFVVYVAYSCMEFMIFKPPNAVMAVFVYFVMVIYMVVPFKFDIMQYEQIAKIYDEENNNYKIWSLAFVGCVEHFLHILLLMNVFLCPSLGALLTDFGIFYISLWLLRNGLNGGAVCPFKEKARKEAYSKFTKY